MQSTIPSEIASNEGLRYVCDAKTGFTRKRHGKKFTYFDQHGKQIRDAAIVGRIQSIGIPPAYEKVWISPWANGHIQATGLDVRGRKQYRYHTKWREIRDQNKFEHILHFAAALPAIREQINRDLKLDGMPRAKVLASITRLLEKTLIRVGNEEYAKSNESYGLTTLRRKHVKVTGDHIRFHFMGKSGKEWDLSIDDHKVARIMKKCSELPGHELFKYIDENKSVHEISSADVNGYLKEITQQDITAKDFRTWSGTVLAALALNEYKKYDTMAEAKKNIVAAIDHVAKQLGNTRSICRKCYIHPEVISAYMDGALIKMIEGEIEKKFKTSKFLSKEETLVLAFLKKRLKAQNSKVKK